MPKKQADRYAGADRAAAASGYEDYWAKLTVSHARHPGNKFRYDLIARELAGHGIQPDRVIDCGCGDGSLLDVVSARIRCGDLHGTDLASNVPISSKVNFRQQDLGVPILDDLKGRFDLVLCSEVIEHVPNDARVVENLAALAKPGGWVVLTTQTGNIYNTEKYLGHLRHYDIGDLRSRLQGAGLTVEKSYVCGWPWLNMQKIAAHHFQGAVQKNIVQAKELSLPVRTVFSVMRFLYALSIRGKGPQIFLLARKPHYTG